MIWTDLELRQIFSEVQLAPSAHNTQPAMWRRDGNGFILTMDPSRRLPVADHGDYDLLLSLGAQIEGLDLSLRERGHRVAQVQEIDRQHWRIEVESASDRDLLFASIDRRKTYRGLFQPLDEAALTEARAAFMDRDRYLLVDQNLDKERLSAWYDEASFQFFSDSNYVRELYSWLRFDKNAPAWRQDGLNGDAMALSAMENAFAKYLLRPKVFRFLKRAGLGKPLISETAKNRAAGFFLLLVAGDADLADPMNMGRRFYRDWLQATRIGVSLCPVSNLVDNPATRKRIEKEFGIQNGKRLFKIFRAGRAPENAPGRYRLPLNRYLDTQQREMR